MIPYKNKRHQLVSIIIKNIGYKYKRILEGPQVEVEVKITFFYTETGRSE